MKLSLLLVAVNGLLVRQLVFILVEDRSNVLASLRPTQKGRWVDVVALIVYGAQLVVVKAYHLLVSVLVLAQSCLSPTLLRNIISEEVLIRIGLDVVYSSFVEQIPKSLVTLPGHFEVFQ
jgi:hypothetical protein